MRRAKLLPLLLTLTGCSTFSPSTSVDIRVANERDVPFDKVIVGFPQGTEEFGPLAPGAESSYVQVGQAYRYAQVEVHIGDRQLRLQPHRLVGETPLEEGRYTYALDVGPEMSQLLLRLVVDR